MEAPKKFQSLNMQGLSLRVKATEALGSVTYILGRVKCLIKHLTLSKVLQK